MAIATGAASAPAVAAPAAEAPAAAAAAAAVGIVAEIRTTPSRHPGGQRDGRRDRSRPIDD